MVRRVWQNRLVQAVLRRIRLFLRWLLVWLQHVMRRTGRAFRVTGWFLRAMVRPRDPNNLYLISPDPSESAGEAPLAPPPELAGGEPATTLLWGGGRRRTGAATQRVSLWRGTAPSAAEDAEAGAEAANRRYAYVDLLATQIRRLKPEDVRLLEELIERLSRKWLDIDQRFERRERRNRLDVHRTLRYNIPRYAGTILRFQWTTKEYPIPEPQKPARLLLIGDVSHSMVNYASIVLYFFHSLNFKFVVDSYVFSERATHSTPYLNGLGTFPEKVKRLVEGARSWNAATWFGSALEEIEKQASVDENTYVLIATDGKISLKGDEAAKVEKYMGALRRKAKQIIFITPSAEFYNASTSSLKPMRLGRFQAGFETYPIWRGSPVWYGTLGRYADQIYLVRTVHDLIDMVETLLINSHK